MLIAITIYDTEENGRLELTKQCLASLADTVDLSKHRLYLVNNASCKASETFLRAYVRKHRTAILINLSENIGTARGINMALRFRGEGENCIKSDNDLTWGVSGWVDEMERVLDEHPEIGILGLKREDVYGTFVQDGELLWSEDIFGTCTAYSARLLNKVGGLVQVSPRYGFDDSIMSVRAIAAGFRNAFLPDIPITNLDTGGSPYTDWKKREAGIYLAEAGILMNLIKEGKVSYYYPFE